MNRVKKNKKYQDWQSNRMVRQRIDRKNYPAAPSAGKEVLKIYNKIIKDIIDKSGNDVLVLGATPEIRDMVVKHGGKLTTVDFSKEMVDKMKVLRKYESKEEKLIIGDWLKLDFPTGSFNLIIGDGVFNNIFPKKHKFFINSLYKLLKPGGFLLVREGVFNVKRSIISPELVDKNFLLGKYHWFDVYFSLLFYSNLKPNPYNKRQQKASLGVLFKHFDKLFKHGVISKRLYDKMAWFASSHVVYVPTANQFKKTLSDYFKLKRITQAKDHNFTKDSFIFWLGKK